MSSDANRDLEQRNGYAGVCSYEACYGNSSFMMDVSYRYVHLYNEESIIRNEGWVKIDYLR